MVEIDPAKCPRVKKDGTQCKRTAGWGTPHPGTGCCRNHGGNAPNHIAKGEKDQAIARMRTYGLPIDTDPQTALLDEVKRTAGHVAWLGEQIQLLELPEEKSDDDEPAERDDRRGQLGLLWHWSKTGQQPNAWVEIYQQERQHLARVCKMALDAGVNERAVRIAEQQGEMLANVIRAILAELKLSREQQQEAPAIVRRHLMAVSS